MPNPEKQLGLQPMPKGSDVPDIVRPQPTVADMLQAVIEKGVTAENVAAVGEIVKLYERMEDKKAEREFTAAFVKLQADMRGIKGTKPVKNKDGTVRYKYAPFEEIMEVVSPKLEAHGFTVTFSTEFDEKRLVKSCTLSHAAGHSKTNKFAVRIGSGPPASSESQADGAASTYAKRFALCDALNIQIDRDTDARSEGAPTRLKQSHCARVRYRSDEARFFEICRC
jgi:hypothetical protein